MHWHDERSDNGLLCKSAVSWILTLLHSRNIGKPPPGMQCLCLVPMIVYPNLHSYRGQTCLSRLRWLLEWRFSGRTALILSLRQPTHHISGQHKFKLGHLNSMASKNMSRPYARYHISFIFLILLGQIRLSCDGGGFSRCPALPLHTLVN